MEYKHFDLDHEHLFGICATLKGDFLMTYDNAEEVKELARKHNFKMRLIPQSKRMCLIVIYLRILVEVVTHSPLLR